MNTIYTGSPATAMFDIVLNPGTKTYPNNSIWDVTRPPERGTAHLHTSGIVQHLISITPLAGSTPPAGA